MQSIYVGFLSLMFVITTMAVPDFVQTLTEGDKNVVLLVTPWIKTSKTGVLRLGLDDNFFKTSSVINGKCRLKHAWASTCLKVERRSVALCFVTCSWSSNLKLIGCSSQYKKLEIYSMIFETADTLNEQRKIYILKRHLQIEQRVWSVHMTHRPLYLYDLQCSRTSDTSCKDSKGVICGSLFWGKLQPILEWSNYQGILEMQYEIYLLERSQ